jgi:asparagine synthase (glutamine-hydrolysing)
MDWRLVRYVFSLPESSKIGAGFTKRVAREAMKGRIPESIRTARHKIGFNSPMPEWFQGPLNSWILEIAGSRTTREHDLIDGERFSKAATSLCREGTWDWRNAGSIWPVLHYLWFENRFLKG